VSAALDIDAFLARVSRQLVLRVSIGSLVVFAALAWLVTVVQGRSLASLHWTEQPLPKMLALGLLAGVAASLAVTAAVLYAPLLRGFRAFLRAAYASARLRRADMLVVALNAGVGEELLFRGALQPLLGLAWTSLAFALLHTGIPRSPALAAFALYTFAMGLGLGAFYERCGLAAAMAAHAAFDFVFLVWSAHALPAAEPARAPAPGP
jgi:membrane protease YdiL (CAAX protease family)